MASAARGTAAPSPLYLMDMKALFQNSLDYVNSHQAFLLAVPLLAGLVLWQAVYPVLLRVARKSRKAYAEQFVARTRHPVSYNQSIERRAVSSVIPLTWLLNDQQ